MERKTLFAAIISLALLSSCATVYVPNAHNVPLISEKDELQAGVIVGTSCFDLQAAYGLTDKVALMANTTFSDRNANSEEYHKHWMYEGAVGYYKKLSRNGRFEVYGGGGYGYTKDYGIEDAFASDYAEGHYAKLFLQSNVGASSDIFDGVFSMRLCDVHFYDYQHQNWEYGSENMLFVEPVLTGKIGYKNVKFITQIGFSVPVWHTDIESFNPFILNMGLNFKINTNKHDNTVK